MPTKLDLTTRIAVKSRLRRSRRIEAPDPGAKPGRGDAGASYGVPADDPPTEQIIALPYLFDDGVVEAVNIAITLRRPLLLQGDPGCGKTQLAHAVAYRLGYPLEAAYVKSTGRAQDLLYTFDAVSRLYEAQLGPAAPLDASGHARSLDPRNYVRLGPFGRAVVRSGFGRPSVVLIDEIDKADLDFPNDLLREMEALEFSIPETGERFRASPEPEKQPIVFVTNNEEKALPPAFLRRCIFAEVRFPEKEGFLADVLAAHGAADPELGREVIRAVAEIRKLDLSRKPGISELLDWALVLTSEGATPAEVRTLPSPGALIKAPQDLNAARRVLAGP